MCDLKILDKYFTLEVLHILECIVIVNITFSASMYLLNSHIHSLIAISFIKRTYKY